MLLSARPTLVLALASCIERTERHTWQDRDQRRTRNDNANSPRRRNVRPKQSVVLCGSSRKLRSRLTPMTLASTPTSVASSQARKTRSLDSSRRSGPKGHRNRRRSAGTRCVPRFHGGLSTSPATGSSRCGDAGDEASSVWDASRTRGAHRRSVPAPRGFCLTELRGGSA